MNMGLLALTGIWLKYKRKAIRLLFGAGIGGISSCVFTVFPIFPRWAELLFTYLLIGPVMCRAAFGKKGIKAVCKAAFVLAAVSIFIGGFLNQLYFYTGAGYVMRELLTGKRAQGGGLPVLLLLAAVSFFAGKEVFFLFGTMKRDRTDLFRVLLIKGNKQVEVTALLDTGNRLYEPVTKKPVSVGEMKALSSLFPEEEEKTEGFLLIPYHSIGGDGFLKGRKLDQIALVREDGSSTPFPEETFLVALKEGQLSKDGSYQLILHGDFAGITASLKKRRIKTWSSK
ncbi:MAG: sigma-E processing peptidase SpoIIGA [Lachnospiraceae bacterium]|nr:sigma-E processing peptidase SpoIIGA [Lachnospiraceae bacterium]